MLKKMRQLIIPGVDKQLLVKDAVKLMPDLSRRRFIASGASFGALTLLTGCNVSDSVSAESLLTQISKFNDMVQAKIFNPNVLAPTYSEKDIKRPFPFNGFYSEDEAPVIDGKEWKLEVSGLVDNRKSWTLEELHKLPEVSQITRHICCRGLECHRLVAGHAAARFPQADRRRHECEVGLFPLRRGLFLIARHADCAACADADDVQV